MRYFDQALLDGSATNRLRFKEAAECAPPERRGLWQRLLDGDGDGRGERRG